MSLCNFINLEVRQEIKRKGRAFSHHLLCLLPKSHLLHVHHCPPKFQVFSLKKNRLALSSQLCVNTKKL